MFQKIQYKISILSEIVNKIIKFSEKYNILSNDKQNEIIQKINNNDLNILVVGKVKSGKSTLINAMLFNKEILPAFSTPTSTVPIKISNGPIPKYFLKYKNNVTKEVTSDLFKNNISTQSYDNELLQGEVSYPINENFKNINFWDTPGIEDADDKLRSEIVYNVIPKSNIIIVVLNGTAPLSSSEMSFIRNLSQRDIQKLFFVVNKIDHFNTSEVSEIKKFTEDNLKDVVPQLRVVMISALKALNPQESDEFKASNIEELKSIIENYLENDSVNDFIEQLKNHALDFSKYCLTNISNYENNLPSSELEIEEKINLLNNQLIDLENSMNQSIDNAKNKVNDVIQNVENNLNDFHGRYKRDMEKLLKKTSLENLKNIDLLQKTLIEKYKGFIENISPAISEKVSEINNELISKTNVFLNNSLEIAKIKNLNLYIAPLSPKSIEEHISPALLLTSWFFLGWLDFFVILMAHPTIKSLISGPIAEFINKKPREEFIVMVLQAMDDLKFNIFKHLSKTIQDMTKDGFNIIKKRYLDDYNQVSVMLTNLKQTKGNEHAEIEKKLKEIIQIKNEIQQLSSSIKRI